MNRRGFILALGAVVAGACAARSKPPFQPRPRSYGIEVRDPGYPARTARDVFYRVQLDSDWTGPYTLPPPPQPWGAP